MRYNDAVNLVNSLKSMRENATDQLASVSGGVYPQLTQSGSLVKAGTRINYNGKVLRAAVDLYDRKDTQPDKAPTLWEELQYKDGARIIPDVITVGTKFSKGEKGWWKEKVYESLIDNNVWTPDQAPNQWKAV